MSNRLPAQTFGLHLRALATTWLTAWQEAWANRRGFWTQVSIMIVNDVVWVAFWVLFFRRVGELRGWDVDLVLVLLAILTTSGGVVLGLLANARSIGRAANDGTLDASLSLPTPTLPYLLCRRVDTTNVGDVAFGIGLFLLVGNPTPVRALLFVFGVVCSVLTITGFLVLAGSLGIFSGRDEAGELGFHALLLFSAYPVDVFAGVARLMLYVVIPAGFVSAAPARLVNDFNLRWAAAGIAVALTFAAAGWFAFRLGLRRYTSGAVWTEA